MKFSKIARSYYAFFFLEETKISVKTILKYWGQKKCLKFVRELHRSKERLHTRCPNAVVIVNAYTTHFKNEQLLKEQKHVLYPSMLLSIVV